MADFSTFQARKNALSRASGLIDRILAAYSVSVGVRDELAAYQAGSDAELVTAINAAFSPAQRQELGQIAQALAAFAAEMETNHPGVIPLL